MQFVLSGLLWDRALCYLDDVISLGSDFESKIANLREIFGRFREHNLKMKPKKCVFQEQVEYLGRLVSDEGVTLRPEHVQVIRDWPLPTTKQELQSFLGFANYHREYITNYSVVVEVLQQLVNNSKPGPIQLAQCHLGNCFWELFIDPAQRRYCTTRKELYAVIRFTRQFRHYLLGRNFIVRTDHNSLTWLMSFKNIEGKLARWMEELSQFDKSVVHRAGKLHANAYALSRILNELEYCPNYQSSVGISKLPCYSAENPC